MKTPVSRRNLLMGTAALGTTGLLAACGGGKSNKPGGAAATDSADVLSRVNVNKQEYSSLKKGGELRLVVTSLGPNFNTLTQTGYTTSNLDAINACNIPSGAGFFNVDYNGDLSLNSDLCLEHKAETKDGKQIIRMKLNPKAKFNDGTPMDIEAVRACWTLYGKTTEETGYELLESEAWKLVESIEEDGDKFSVKITTKSPYYPAESLFATAVHPALTDKELFNQGFVDKPLDQYWAGPYKVAENGWNSAEKTLTLVPNPTWWGEKKALLDRIVWREMTTDAIRAAFKNGDVDATQFVENNTYTELKGQAGTDIREGQRTGVRGVHLNPKRITDLALRRAIAAALDRAQLANVMFSQLGWSEPMPGSIVFMPFQRGYEDNYPKETGADAAKKILEEAGYKLNGDIYEKDGKKAEFSITYFGGEATTQALARSFAEQMSRAGIKVNTDNQPSSNYTSVIGSKSYEAILGGFGTSLDPAESAVSLYHSANNNGVGDPEIDKFCEELLTVESREEQLKMTNKLEKMHLEKVVMYLPYANGPEYYAVKSKLANYGPSLFKTSYTSADYWMNVGWQE